MTDFPYLRDWVENPENTVIEYRKASRLNRKLMLDQLADELAIAAEEIQLARDTTRAIKDIINQLQLDEQTHQMFMNAITLNLKGQN